ncbi:MAG: HMA2 domain-containing protein [Candidatus Binatia bacterium]
MNAAAVTVVHAIPGRIRLKVAQVRDNPTLATEIQHRLTSLTGVRQVEASARTGSVLILYDAAILANAESLRALAEPLATLFPGVDARDLEALATVTTNGTAAATTPILGQGLRSFFSQLNRNLSSATGGSLDLKILPPLLLFALGVRSLLTSEKPLSPTWYDFLWFALGTYFMLNPKPDEKRP